MRQKAGVSSTSRVKISRRPSSIETHSTHLSAAVGASAWNGLWLGLGFGLGAIVIPTIFYGIGFAWFGSRLRELLSNSHKHIVRLSAGLLIVTGTSNLLA